VQEADSAVTGAGDDERRQNRWVDEGCSLTRWKEGSAGSVSPANGLAGVNVVNVMMIIVSPRPVIEFGCSGRPSYGQGSTFGWDLESAGALKAGATTKGLEVASARLL